jgi:alpha-mannosidase
MDFELGKINRLLKDFKIYITKESVSINQYKAKEGRETHGEKADTTCWEDYATGDLWGGYDRHMWFRTTLIIPESYAGEHVVYRISTGHEEGWDIANPQFLCYVDGEIRQGLDVNHRDILLTKSAVPGTVYEIALIGYSGLNQEKVYLKSELAVLDLAIEDFYYNLKNLFRTACVLEKDNTDRVHLMEVMKTGINLLDLRKVYSVEFYDGLSKANAFLKAKYYSKNRKEGPVVTTIGHTHIDVAWLWSVDQTKEKVVRSFSTVLNYMEQYPEYKFMSSQPQLYAFLKEKEPELYEKVKEKVKEGRWEVDGGMWLEADCNIPSGESLVRQFLYGEKFIREEFGKKSKTLWLPDVFGYSAALPQILKKCGIKYFFTTKLDWNQYNKMPHDTFLWKGIDGSEVLTQLVTTTGHVTFDKEVLARKNPYQQTTYNGRLESNQVLGNWTRYKDKQLCEETLHPFGFGDGGGGPTEEQLKNYSRLKYGLPGIPRVAMDFQGNYFERLNESIKERKDIAKWAGELYFECHRGTYTSMAKNKRFNRKAENMYMDLEFLSVLAESYGDVYPSEELEQGWKLILLNQFHDIIPGTSIEAVYQQTDSDYRKLLKKGAKLIENKLNYISSQLALKKMGVVIFNTLSFNREDRIQFTLSSDYKDKISSLTDEYGNRYACQKLPDSEDYICQVAGIPAKGFKVLYMDSFKPDIEAEIKAAKERFKEERAIETDFYRVVFDEEYHLASLWDKKADREVLKPGEKGNVLEIYEDRPMDFENWDIDIYHRDKLYTITQFDEAVITEWGPVRIGILITRTYFDSVIKQHIFLYPSSRRIDFHTEIDWHEHQVLLKVLFPVDIHAEKASYDIQYGNVERNTHENTSWDMAKFEVCAHKWADISEYGYGVSLLNDCKYGHDIKDGDMRLTLLKCGQYPNKNADQGLHEFTYSLYPHMGGWREGNTQLEAYSLNTPLYARWQTPQGGNKATELSLFFVKQDNCIIETVKKSEDGKGYILRVYEYKNRRTKVSISSRLALHKVYLCNLLEEKEKELKAEEDVFCTDIKPYEILTFYIETRSAD